jgi:hypothetical protein
MSFRFCDYQHIFGEPNKGVHSTRIFNLAIVDVVGTVLIAYFIAKHFKFPFLYTLLAVFIFGIACHRLFCVKTTIDKILFEDNAMKKK